MKTHPQQLGGLENSSSRLMGGHQVIDQLENRDQRSAPVDIPTSSSSSAACYNGGRELEDDHDQYCDHEYIIGDDQYVPPHLIVARREEKRGSFWSLDEDHMTELSVCSGRGRTLKGRDLRRLRNSVLQMTGFLEGRLVLF